MNKHQTHDLKQMQSLPLEAKILMSERRIEDWFDYWDGEVYVSFSGGKDSTVLADMVARFCKKYGWKLYLLFVNTGLEYPEIQKFVRTYAEWLRKTYSIDVQLDVVRPDMRFDDVVKTFGYPVISKSISKKVGIVRRNGKGCDTYKFFLGTASTKDGKPSKFNCKKWSFLLDADFDSDWYCCEMMKKIPFKKYEKETSRRPIVGTLASESETREAVWMKHGCNAFSSSHPSSQPLSFWTNQDILHYIKKFNVPYCSVYGDIQVKQPEGTEEGQINVIDFLGCYEPEDILETTGCDRTGCIFCMYGCHLEKEPNRFQRLKETHPRQYEYCIGGGEMVDGKWQPNKEGLGLGHILDYIGVKYV
jgi:3'-phosphoadenosine 5'-phosphosulfate sulfotransferase (PAPS reductase)/FAD synthetase